jgi:hypothetical protein
VLESNVAASLGPYRLVLDTDSGTVADAAATQFGEVSPNTIVPLPKVAPKVEPARQPVPVAIQKKRDEPKPKPKPAPSSGAKPKWLLGAIAALLVAASAFGVWRLVTRQPAPPSPVVLNLESQKRQIESGDCQGALRQIEAVLAENPGESRASQLKARAEACLQAAPPPPPPEAPSAGDRLSAAALMLASGDCAGALTEHINPVLEADPANAEAAAMKKQADACVLAANSKPASTNADLAKALPPESGGLQPNKGELSKSYLARVQVMKDRYTEAMSAYSSAEYQRAATLFEGIVRDAGPKYLDASERLADARKSQRDGAQKNLQTARDFESKGEWDRAIEAYRRARQADASINVDADVARITTQKSRLGRKACEDANVRYGYGRNAEALPLYQEAMKLLPADDPCIVTAKERFPALRK